jgi:hypothetical protein
LLLLFAGGIASLFLPPVKQKVLTIIDRLRTERVVTKKETVERVVEKRVEVPVPVSPEPLPSRLPVGARKDVATIVGDIQLESNLVATEGGRATKERAEAGSYAVEFNFKIRIPKAATTLEDFAAINPSLPELLPSFKDLLATAKVSGFYHFLYQEKQKSIQANILRLDRVLSRHNFYDLESVLELEHAGTKQKALLIQAEMDVVSDGSDGDRMESFDDYIFKSQHFQPTTSYSWEKVTTKQNPVIPRLQEELRVVGDKLKSSGLSNSDKAGLKDRAAAIPRIISELKRRSFLIAQEDPFIVIPMSFRAYRGAHAFAPSIGDCAVVICGDRMMPAIVGDYGPAAKCGEASLRIAREIDPKSGPYHRPVSDLRVTYLIFPDSAAKQTGAPDYAAWHKRCSELLARLGGNAAVLHQWKDRLKKEPPPPAAADSGSSAGSDSAPETDAATDKPATPP